MGIDRGKDETSSKSLIRKVVPIDPSRVKRLRQNGSYELNLSIREKMDVWRNPHTYDPAKQDRARERLMRVGGVRRVD